MVENKEKQKGIWEIFNPWERNFGLGELRIVVERRRRKTQTRR